WLHRVAVNVILTRRAGHAVRRERIVAGGEGVDTPAPPAAGGGHRGDLRRAIALPAAGARGVLVLGDGAGYKREGIAAALGVTTGTSKAQLHRARMLLRGHLEGSA